MTQLKSKVTGEILDVVPYNEPISKGYVWGAGQKVNITTVKDSNGNYFGIEPKNLKLFEVIQ